VALIKKAHIITIGGIKWVYSMTEKGRKEGNQFKRKRDNKQYLMRTDGDLSCKRSPINQSKR